MPTYSLTGVLVNMPLKVAPASSPLFHVMNILDPPPLQVPSSRNRSDVNLWVGVKVSIPHEASFSSIVHFDPWAMCSAGEAAEAARRARQPDVRRHGDSCRNRRRPSQSLPPSSSPVEARRHSRQSDRLFVGVIMCVTGVPGGCSFFSSIGPRFLGPRSIRAGNRPCGCEGPGVFR